MGDATGDETSRGTWRHLARAGRRGGFATHLLLRVAVRVSGNTDASVVPILAVRGLRRPPLLALHLEARGSLHTEDSRTVGRASYCGARRRTRAEKSPRKRALLKDNPRVKESEATRASLRDVELCDEEAKDPSPTQKWRVKNAFEESRSVRASLVTGRGRTRASARWVRVASSCIARDYARSRCPEPRTPRVELWLDRARPPPFPTSTPLENQKKSSGSESFWNLLNRHLSQSWVYP